MATGHSKDFFLSGLLRLVCPHSRRAGGCNKHRDLWKPTVSTREVSKQTRLSDLQGVGVLFWHFLETPPGIYGIYGYGIWGNMLNLGTTLFFRTWPVAWPIALMACAWRAGRPWTARCRPLTTRRTCRSSMLLCTGPKRWQSVCALLARPAGVWFQRRTSPRWQEPSFFV